MELVADTGTDNSFSCILMRYYESPHVPLYEFQNRQPQRGANDHWGGCKWNTCMLQLNDITKQLRSIDTKQIDQK